MTDQEIRAHFHACDKCEPVMCCYTFDREFPCGCMCMPVEFHATKECPDDCELKESAKQPSKESEG